MNYLVDPFAGELVEFSKAIPSPASMRNAKWAPAAQKGLLAGKSGARRVRDAAHGAWNNHRTPMAFAGGAVAGATGERMKRREVGKAVTNPQFGTNVRSVKAIVPTGRHVSHENDLQVYHGKTKHKGPAPSWERYGSGSRHKGPEKGLERYGKRDQSEGGALIVSRGTPMSAMAHVGRQGRRLATV